MNTLGDFLQQKRDEIGLSNDDLAQAAGVDVSTMGQILSGEILRPPDARLQGLAERLGVNVEDLIALVPADRQDAEEVTQGTAPNSIQLRRHIALNADGSVPEWIELLPPGPEIRGVDGRTWLNDRPAVVVRNTRLPFPLDWEHATELKAPKGEQAPAAAWVEALEDRSGATWGRVAWNAAGRDSVANREYRFISPVLLYEKQSKRIVRLTSAALTNSPNLPLTALNSREEQAHMDPDILKALGLAADADAAAVVTAINRIKAERDATVAELAVAKNREDTPDLTKFVPRADYDATLLRTTNAEQTLQDHTDAAHQAEIDTAIDAAVKDGMIAPCDASVDYHKDACSKEGGLDRFKAYVEGIPPIFPQGSSLEGKQPPDAKTILTPDEKALCRQMGLDETEYLKTKELEHAAL